MFKRLSLIALILLSGLFMVRIVMSQPQVKVETTQEGTGATAAQGMSVDVHYTGKLENGEVFDSSIPRGQPLSFTLGEGRVIAGWEQGIMGMAVGEKRVLTIPPELGYGAQGAGGVIPPNATLIFEVELMGVSEPATLGQTTPAEFTAAQAAGGLVVDIRRPDEWAETGIIEGAHTVTAFTETGQLHPDFQETFFSLLEGPDTPVLLYCRSGNRTGMLGNLLIEQAGLSNVTHLSEGIIGWQQSEQPVVPYAPKP